MKTGTKIVLGVGGYLLVGAAVWAKKDQERQALCALLRQQNPTQENSAICNSDTPELDLASTMVLWPIDLLQMVFKK